MREAFKNNHQLEPSPVLDKIKLNVDPVSIHVKSYPEDSRLPPVQRAEIQKYLGLPQQRYLFDFFSTSCYLCYS